jgi:hypothetical protein
VRYLIRALIVVVALAVLVVNPVVGVSPSGTTYLFWDIVIDAAAIAAIAASAATWRQRIA